MQAAIRTAWTTALHNGEYAQGRERLRRDNAFCCLGVLCDIHARAGLGEWDADTDHYRAAGEVHSYSGGLPPTVCAWAGLSISDPQVPGGCLSALNDGRGGLRSHTFAEIADLIERHL